jgi:polysaccharide export outer membrane protein
VKNQLRRTRLALTKGWRRERELAFEICRYMIDAEGIFRDGAREKSRLMKMGGTGMSTNLQRTAMTKLGAMSLLALSLSLAGCAGTNYKRADIAAPQPEFLTPPDQVFVTNRDVKLGPSDLVTVMVYKAPEFSGEYRVDDAGKIMMPLIGSVPVQGMTTTELAADLRARLSKSYYVNPDVSVALKESVSQQIVVDGSVGRPGEYPLTGRTTLMEAVARAGGVGPDSNLRRVVVFRTINGQRMAAAFDLAAIREARAKDPEIFAQDIIIVDGSRTRQALRDFFLTLPIIGLFRPFIL